MPATPEIASDDNVSEMQEMEEKSIDKEMEVSYFGKLYCRCSMGVILSNYLHDLTKLELCGSSVLYFLSLEYQK